MGSPDTAPADHQRIARMLLDRVVVTVDKASERVDVALHWVGGDVRSDTLTRPVRRYDQHSEYPRLTARLRVLCGQRRAAVAIAAHLNAEGFHPPKRTTRFTRPMCLRLIGQLGLGCRVHPPLRVRAGPRYALTEPALESAASRSWQACGPPLGRLGVVNRL